MSNPKYAATEAAGLIFNLVRGALGDLVDGEHVFDIVADDVVTDVLDDFSGWPRMIEGRADPMVRFRSYGGAIAPQSADRLTTHETEGGRVVVVE